MLRSVITLWEIVEKPKNFLPKVTFSETFWQLDCQIAALFPPMPICLTHCVGRFKTDYRGH